MKAIHFVFTMAAGLALAACTADEQTIDNKELVPVQLSINQDLGDSFTRTANDLHSATTGLAAGEQMTVLMKNGDATTGKTYEVLSVSSGTATLSPSDAADPLYYPVGNEGSVSLYAVYPAGVTTTSGHTVAYDQTTDAAYQASDLMYSPAKSVSLADKGDVQALNAFAHQMVRLKLTVVKGAGITSVTQVKMNNVKRAVSVTTLDETGITLGEATEASDATGNEILISSGMTAASETYYVVFPKQVAEGNDWSAADFITITANGAPITYNLTKAFTAGRQYNLTLTLTAATLGTTVTIDDWAEGTTWDAFNKGGSSFIEPPLALGDPYYSDGTWGDNPHAEGATVIGVVAWLGDDSDLKCGKAHGLVVAKTDCTGYYAWGESDDEPFLYNHARDVNDCKNNCKNGLENTNNLLNDGHTHPAATAARNYTPAAPTSKGATQWFLPSVAQWFAVIGPEGIGQFTGGTSIGGSCDRDDHTFFNNFNSAMTREIVGGSGLQAVSPYQYITSSEFFAPADNAVNTVLCFRCYPQGANLAGFFMFWGTDKTNANNAVRPFLAF